MNPRNITIALCCAIILVIAAYFGVQHAFEQEHNQTETLAKTIDELHREIDELHRENAELKRKYAEQVRIRDALKQQIAGNEQIIAEYEAEKKASERKAVDFTRDTDRLMAARTFIIHDKKRVFKVFDLTGKLIEEKKDTLQDGVMSYTITSPTTAIIFGNVGSAEVEFTRADRSITFIETTPAGNKNIMVIYDEWDDKEKGFRFIYTRNIKSPMINELMKTTATGIAKIN